MTDLSPERLSAIVGELLEGWKRYVGDPATTLGDWNGRSDAQVAMMMTLTAHIHASAMILRPAMPDGLTIAHAPLLRSVFEATVTVVWADEVADGAFALINDGARQRRNLQASMADTQTLADLAAKIAVVDGLGSLPTSSQAQARSFESRCGDVAADWAYPAYRMLSGLSHPSIDTVDAYIDGESFRPGRPISIKSNPGPLASSRAWAHSTAACLVWSGRVVDYLDRKRTRRDLLRRYARELGIADVMSVKYSAHKRGQTANRRNRPDV